MNFIRIGLVAMCLFIAPMSVTAAESGQEIVDRINRESARRNRDYFMNHLSNCPETQIRCLWFLSGGIGAGIVMTIDLGESTVFTVRDVFNHARQNSRTQKLRKDQIYAAREVVAGLPESAPGVMLADGVHIAFWRNKQVEVRSYPKKTVPVIVQRLYDVGGGATDFTYAK